MGEEIEVTDHNGNLVKVLLSNILQAIGATLEDGQSKGVTRKDGRRVEVRLEPVDHAEDAHAEKARGRAGW